jgi:hypothetical protein
VEAIVLPTVNGDAANDQQRCYKKLVVMLLEASDGATSLSWDGAGIVPVIS